MKRNICLLLLLSIGLLTSNACAKHAKETKSVEVPPVPVITANPTTGTVTEWHKTTAELSSPLKTSLSFSTGGRIVELKVKEGDRVSAGQYLGRVDTAIYEAQLSAARAGVDASKRQAEAASIGARAAKVQVETAQAAFEQAERDYNRFKNLLEQGVATQSEFERVELGYISAKNALQAAKDGAEAAEAQATAAEEGVKAAEESAKQVIELINNGVLTAPFSGRISRRMADPGSVTGPGVPVYELVAEGDAASNVLEVRYSIPENLTGRIKVGSKIFLKLISIDTEVELKVDSLIPVVDSSSRTVKMKSFMPTDTLPIMPGMFGTVRIPVEVHENVIILPETAVLDLETEEVVYVAEGNTAKRKLVKTGLREEGKVEIMEGISLADKVIIEGNRYLSDGAKIVVQEQKASIQGEAKGAQETPKGGAD